jgi:tetratricopeptide (TPR) repeat protein
MARMMCAAVVALSLGSVFGCKRSAARTRGDVVTSNATAATVTPDGGTRPECDGIRERMLVSARQDKTSHTLDGLNDAYRACGDGHGLLGLMAQVQFDRGNLTDAVDLVRRELLAPHPSPATLQLAKALLEKLPRAQGSTLQDLGKTPDAPVHIRRFLGDGDFWIEEIVCRGVDSKGFSRSGPVAGHPELHRTWVECPPGEKHAVFLWEDEPPRRVKPYSFDQPTPDVNHVVDRLRDKFGIENATELRQALLEPEPSRSHAWVLEHVGDSPELIREWEALLEEDPDDLEAIFFRAQEQAAVGDLDGAIATLAHASPDRARVRDLRAFGGMILPSSILSYQCAFLFKQRKLEEARARCNDGIAAGSSTVSNAYLARIALWQGDLESAETFARRAAEHGNSREWTLLGIVLTRQGRPDEARLWLRKAAAAHPPVWIATQLLKGVTKRARDWLVDEETVDRQGAASALAECGHIYLELDVPERSERCFRISENLMYGPSEAQRAAHLSETDAGQALIALEQVLKASHNPDVLVAKALVEHRLGKDAESLIWIGRALELLPGHSGAQYLLKDICGKLGDAGCGAARERLALNLSSP